MRRLCSLVLAVVLLLPLAGCGKTRPIRYRSAFYGTFDTVVQVIGYADGDSFDSGMALLKSDMERYNALFDRYHDYEGVNNIKTINDNAGIQPVQVDPVLFDLLEKSKEWYVLTDGTVNVAYGPVLEVWHEYRERYANSEEGELPPPERLEEAARHTDIDKVILNREQSTVYLSEPEMSLDVGAMAKGFATERAGQALYDSELITSFLLSSGGNVRAFDPPLNEELTAWNVGIQDPKQNPMETDQHYLDTVVLSGASVVTSGNYQRYYVVDGQRIHHIIDPATGYPANRYAAVTVVTEDSGEADLLSTALYILDEEQGRALAEKMGAEALWIYEDGRVEVTDGLVPLLQVRGGATAQAKGEESAGE